ncbi:hypothetical protein ALT761_02510 [Alteromonas sp. 76-1]|jgi:hypothetical protein|uniref:hypothetical protein n=1 Tax=Alteromonas sp. 76-1 TaxID=2358187 RepID=UPI000FD16887|nr:hypothetical protein [Alteromonas sp. 76-1]VEL97506.1 hypothetical protein ALT761_02510 [Alteromonas sp. 76-1]
MTSVGVKSFKSLPGTLPLLSSVTLLAMACSTTVLAHSGHIHNEAFEACETKTKGEACSYLVANTQRYKGSCQVFNLKTLCVRSEPIEYLQTVPDEIEIEVKTDQVTTHQITIDQLGTVKTSNVNAANIPSQ